MCRTEDLYDSLRDVSTDETFLNDEVCSILKKMAMKARSEDFCNRSEDLGKLCVGVGLSGNLSRVNDFLTIMATIKGVVAYGNMSGKSFACRQSNHIMKFCE